MKNNNLIPFGKYKGEPLEMLLADSQYVEWLSSQSWLKEKYTNIYNIVVFGREQDTPTPEHNRMQAKWLNSDYLDNFIAYMVKHKNLRKNHCWVVTGFEMGNIDVKIEGKGVLRFANGNEILTILEINIELKTSVSDDYPSILRKLANQYRPRNKLILITKEFVSEAVTLEQAKKIFKMSSIEFILESEFEGVFTT